MADILRWVVREFSFALLVAVLLLLLLAGREFMDFEWLVLTMLAVLSADRLRDAYKEGADDG